ncbi:hypothetical protein, unlikely [Trypanosoma brucei brucei TREU927]|uniref:Uncharacterized protein n=1 Tax=Trypanosoma brucei brucei (strain 927/4 GUTat10.1) TaxID=185431 RepID=Q4GZC6_TRYB2|nr:hypothetical protein, unlikely [Trypanosoma brucei brucei TREU927]CAJ16015.1 hypothetical protein, unlikely [Trypanosoma brucei brucei TREU927]
MMRRKREESAEGKERCGYDGYPSNPQQSAAKKQGLHLLGGHFTGGLTTAISEAHQGESTSSKQ